MPSLKEGHRIGCWKLVAGRFHFAKTGPDDSCTPAFFWTGSVWPQPDSRLEPNRIWVGFVQYDPDCLWKNGTESDVGHWKRGGSILPDPGPKSSAHRVFFLTGSVLPQPDSHSEPNRIWAGFDLILDGFVRLWPRGSVLEANRCAEIIGPGSGKMELARFQFSASNAARIILCDTGLDLIWFRMAMSGCVQTDLFWKQAGVQESSVLVPSKRNRPTSSFPASDAVLFFHKQPGSYCAIWFLMATSGCGQMDPIRKQTDVQNSLGSVLAKRNRPASYFPHSIWFCSSTDGLDHIVRNRPGSSLVLGGHVGLWPNGSGPEAS